MKKFSIYNALLLVFAKKWPFIIDTQGQGINFIWSIESQAKVRVIDYNDILLKNYIRDWSQTDVFIIDNCPTQIDSFFN
jgi:hypothetical protein